MRQLKYLLWTHIIALACITFLIGTAIATAPEAHASSLKFAATCSGVSCDGQGPSSSGCWTTNLRPIATAPILDTYNHSHGTLQLWYSPICQTNWGQVITSDRCSVNGVIEDSYIVRKGGVDGPYENLTGYKQDPGCVEHTPMVWAPDVPVSLSGSIVENCGPNCAAQYVATIAQPGF